MDSSPSLSASQAQAAAQAINDLKEAKNGDPFSPEEQATAVAAAVDARTAHEDEMHAAQEQSKLDAAPGLMADAPADEEEAPSEFVETPEEDELHSGDIEEDNTPSSGV